MTKSAHDGTAFATPLDIILMAPDASFVERRQQRNRNLFGQFFFMASRTLTAFAIIPVRIDIKIMMADPAPKIGFVQIMVKPHGMLMKPAEFSAFEIHDSCTGLFILGPRHWCRQKYGKYQTQNNIPILHAYLLR